MAEHEAAVRNCAEARIRGDVFRDEESSGRRSVQPPLHRLRALGKTERDGGFVAQAGDSRARDEPSVACVIRTDAHSLNLEALREVVSLAYGHCNADRSC